MGKTADAGHQIGVRRTLPASEERVWAVLLSPEGLQTWLGGVAPIEVGSRFTFEDGTRGEIRVYKSWSHLRLTWQPAHWAAPSALQLRVIPARTGTTLHSTPSTRPSASIMSAFRYTGKAGALAAGAVRRLA